MAKTTYKKETYGWGDLRVLRKGNDYTCVIQPEHLAAINRGETFTDEQKMRWQPEITDGNVTLRSGNYSFTIPLNQLNA